MGRIIMCYAGVGKTTLATNDKNYIDLDSRFFDDMATYALLALYLAAAGHDVLVSAHSELYDKLRWYKVRNGCDAELIIVYPSIVLREAWCKKLLDRCLASDSDGDIAALFRAVDCYESDIRKMMEREGQQIVIDDIGTYDLGLLLADTPDMAYKAIKNEKPRDGNSFWWKGEKYVYLDDEWMDEERFDAYMQFML